MKKTFYTLIFVLFTIVSFGQWSEQTSGTTHELEASFFLNGNVGYFSGWNGTDAIVLKTTDGGLNYTPLNFTLAAYCTSIWFID